MNLDDAVSAHQKWKIRLGMVIEGNSSDALDPSVVEKDNQCDLGKWLHGDGRIHQGKVEFAPLVSEHAAFHRHAAGVLRMALKGDLKAAKADLDGPYYQQSQKVVMAILKLKKALQ
jgi:hypothetical protein